LRFYVGTSGWRYFWNEGNSLDWYIQNTKFNSIELNASFYRFPFPNQVKSWARKGRDLVWSIKVSRVISHMYKLSDKAISVFEKFRNLFKPMEELGLIRFYLIQLPSIVRCNERNLAKIKNFLEQISIRDKIAIEFRHSTCFSKEVKRLLSRLGVTMVSIDSPDTGFMLFQTYNTIYLRLHGRTIWYHHIYSDDEIDEILTSILRTNAEEVFIYLNNDHGMLPTGIRIINKLNELAKSGFKIKYIENFRKLE